MFAAETAVAVGHAGWFLENAWLIPFVPAVGFAIILFFGKRLPLKGSEVGLGSLAASFVLSIGAAYQWIMRVRDAGQGGGSALGTIGRSLFVRLSEEKLPAVPAVIHEWNWFRWGGTQYRIGTHIDGLAVCLIVVVSLIASLIQLYSMEYVRGDVRFTHFFASLTLFASGMLTMVTASNTVMFILGWEIMGLCSFLLIGHWWEDQANSRAALKAFFTVRVGDIGLVTGMSILFWASGSSTSIEHINEWAMNQQPRAQVIFWAAMALLLAVIGKSGQFPLHTWLPDAMAGPTPVSALLHSSTMVVAGIYLVARFYPVFYIGFDIHRGVWNPMALIAGITVIIAALLAFVQVDIKRVLAYSTVSQLGYMLLGLSVGAWTPAVFHIFTHAFFKACLFLAAGSVAHSGSHHSFDMKKDMGGLRKKMPITFWTFVVSTIALAGIIPFSGFWSKDEIVANAGENNYKIFMVVGLVGGFLTAAYMVRCIYLTFFGEPRGAAAGIHHDDHADDHADAHAVDAHSAHSADAHGHDTHDAHAPLAVAHAGHGDEHAGPHESNWYITTPLLILATLAAISGFLLVPPAHFEPFLRWVQPRIDDAAKAFPDLTYAPWNWGKAMLAVVIALAGGVVSFFVCQAVYGRNALKDLTRRNAFAKAGYAFLWNKYYLDHLYEKIVVAGVSGPVARLAYWINQNIIDGIVNGVGTVTRVTSNWVYRRIDQQVVDGAVNGAALTAEGTGGALRGVQSGKVQQYGALLFGAAAVGALILVVVI